MIPAMPYIALNVLLILALLRLARSALARRARKEIPTAAAITTPRDYSTATCPLCGKYDESRPFIRHAIDCHRKDCKT